MKNKSSDNVSNRKKGRRGRRIVLIVFAVFIAFITVFLIVECNLHAFGVEQGELNHAYGTVLGDIDGIVDSNPRLSEIAMLGAHDAATYKINKDSELEGAAKQSVLGKLIPITHGMQVRFAKTQTVGLYDQLMQGVRFLHIKYAYDNGDWYGAHSLLSHKLQEEIEDIIRFMSERSGEVVLLAFHATHFGDSSSEGFHEWLAQVSYEGETLYDYVNFGSIAEFQSTAGFSAGPSALRYNQITDSGTRSGAVLFDVWDDPVYAHDKTAELTQKYFFAFENNTSWVWHSQSSSKNLIASIQATADNCAEMLNRENLIRINQTQAAFAFGSFSDAMSCLFKQSLLKIASKHNVALVNHPDFEYWLEMMPIFQVDFATSTYDRFNDKANTKIRAYNQKLCTQEN